MLELLAIATVGGIGLAAVLAAIAGWNRRSRTRQPSKEPR